MIREIQIGDLVQPRKGGDLDCTAFSGTVGLVLASDSFDGLPPNEKALEVLVEWCGRALSLWENREHLEKIDGT